MNQTAPIIYHSKKQLDFFAFLDERFKDQISYIADIKAFIEDVRYFEDHESEDLDHSILLNRILFYKVLSEKQYLSEDRYRVSKSKKYLVSDLDNLLLNAVPNKVYNKYKHHWYRSLSIRFVNCLTKGGSIRAKADDNRHVYLALELLLSDIDRFALDFQYVHESGRHKGSISYEKLIKNCLWDAIYAESLIMRKKRLADCGNSVYANLKREGYHISSSSGTQKVTTLIAKSFHKTYCKDSSCSQCGESIAANYKEKIRPDIETFHRVDGGLSWITLTLDRELLKRKYGIISEAALNSMTWFILSSNWTSFMRKLHREIGRRFDELLDSVSSEEQESLKKEIDDTNLDFDRAAPDYFRKMEVQKNGSAHVHVLIRDPRLLRVLKHDLEVWKSLSEYERMIDGNWVCIKSSPPVHKEEYIYKGRKKLRWRGRAVDTSVSKYRYKEWHKNQEAGSYVKLNGPHHRFSKFLADSCNDLDWGLAVDIDMVDSEEAMVTYLTTCKKILGELLKTTQIEKLIIPRGARIFVKSQTFTSTAASLREKKQPPKYYELPEDDNVLPLYKGDDRPMRSEYLSWLSEEKVRRREKRLLEDQKVIEPFAESIGQSFSSLNEESFESFCRIQEIHHNSRFDEDYSFKELTQIAHKEVSDKSIGVVRPRELCGSVTNISSSQSSSELFSSTISRLSSYDLDLNNLAVVMKIMSENLEFSDTFKAYDVFSMFDESVIDNQFRKFAELMVDYLSKISEHRLDCSIYEKTLQTQKFLKSKPKYIVHLQKLKDFGRLFRLSNDFVFRTNVLVDSIMICSLYQTDGFDFLDGFKEDLDNWVSLIDSCRDEISSLL